MGSSATLNIGSVDDLPDEDSRPGSIRAPYLEVHGWFLSGVISRVTMLITHSRGLITPLITTHEPPSNYEGTIWVSAGGSWASQRRIAGWSLEV